jgi:riboflavin kinase/FMN adenylyltransferase
MDVIHFPDDARPVRWHQPVLALGNFDGVHRGHRKILERVHRVAAERGATSVVMTFDPHPPRVVRPDKAPPTLMTNAQKLEALGEAGLQGAAIVRFTPELSRWDPETFVRAVLVDWLRVSEVWVGANFLFGHDRAGNFTLLRTLGARYGFRAEKIDPVRYKEFVVSSTRIRRLVGEGRVDEADLYGASIRVGFVQRLRDERRFESIEQLKEQIAADCGRARALFDRLSL